jgi:ubiquinone/menaquinone biosynthesis C-methylase UbiE
VDPFRYRRAASRKAGLFKGADCEIGGDGREQFQEIFESVAALHSKSVWTGTRVPRKTATPCITSGSRVIACVTSSLSLKRVLALKTRRHHVKKAISWHNIRAAGVMRYMNWLRVPLALAAAALLAPAQSAPAPSQDEHAGERQDIVVDGLPDSGYILDIGGGCRGTIGRIRPKQVVAIDISPKELKEAPSTFLKIVMDATALKFLDNSFSTVTAYYSLMFMKPDIQEKVFGEVFRVLQPGGTWLVWDAVVPAATPGAEKESYTAWLRTHLPNETIVYGYSVVKFEKPLDVPYYSALATHAGFQIAEVKEQGGGKSFLMKLRKP